MNVEQSLPFDFAAGLAQLAAELREGERVPEATRVAKEFSGASDELRGAFLLLALDDAIAAIEIASRLADAYHGVITDGPHHEAPTTADEALETIYHEFAGSQTQYQALYQYRNALASRLREPAAPVPPEVAGQSDTRTTADASDDTE